MPAMAVNSFMIRANIHNNIIITHFDAFTCDGLLTFIAITADHHMILNISHSKRSIGCVLSHGRQCRKSSLIRRRKIMNMTAEHAKQYILILIICIHRVSACQIFLRNHILQHRWMVSQHNHFTAIQRVDKLQILQECQLLRGIERTKVRVHHNHVIVVINLVERFHIITGAQKQLLHVENFVAVHDVLFVRHQVVGDDARLNQDTTPRIAQRNLAIGGKYRVVRSIIVARRNEDSIRIKIVEHRIHHRGHQQLDRLLVIAIDAKLMCLRIAHKKQHRLLGTTRINIPRVQRRLKQREWWITHTGQRTLAISAAISISILRQQGSAIRVTTLKHVENGWRRKPRNIRLAVDGIPWLNMCVAHEQQTITIQMLHFRFQRTQMAAMDTSADLSTQLLHHYVLIVIAIECHHL
mmetsp:Transcript_18652/g.29633  ORF Transcript_18652/g.29633 Transcript_18652/m.29633 type:complete len:410 (-) Transcript_18652:25-1254(-)